MTIRRSAVRPLLYLVSTLALAACQAPVVTSPGPATGRAALAPRLDSVFADSLFRNAFWGVVVRSLDTGEELYRRSGEKMFVPASNMKIVTAAAALETLGPEHRFRTALVTYGRVEDGVLAGPLIVVGGGDPTIGARFGGGDARAVFRAWADSLRFRGVRRIDGPIVGNDDVFDDVPLGAGWAWDDAEAYYSAEISGLELNEGVVAVQVTGGPRPGAPGRVVLDPPTDYTPVLNVTETVPAGTQANVEVRRAPQGPGIVVSGLVPADTSAFTTTVAVRNNTLYFATVLAETLREAGIEVRGAPVDADEAELPRPARIDTLFVHQSPPLLEVLAAFLKPSQNQYGEILLKTMGSEERGMGTAGAGIAVVDSVMAVLGLPRGKLSQADGSGLSRYNLVAPDFLAELLVRMAREPEFPVFRGALPVAGQDGTLATRMRGTLLAGNVHAKTGTLSGVRSLSGYMTTAAGERIVFSIIANHHTVTSRDVDRVAEAALMEVYRLPR